MAHTVGVEIPSLVIGAIIPRPYVVGGKVAKSCAGGGEVMRPRTSGTKVLPLAVGIKGLVLPRPRAGGKEVPPRVVCVVCAKVLRPCTGSVKELWPLTP